MQKIKIVALIGEAGSGKDFLLRCAREQYPEFHEIISCTTRPKRMGEVEGRNYYFLENAYYLFHKNRHNKKMRGASCGKHRRGQL